MLVSQIPFHHHLNIDFRTKTKMCCKISYLNLLNFARWIDADVGKQKPLTDTDIIADISSIPNAK